MVKVLGQVPLLTNWESAEHLPIGLLVKPSHRWGAINSVTKGLIRSGFVTGFHMTASATLTALDTHGYGGLGRTIYYPLTPYRSAVSY